MKYAGQRCDVLINANGNSRKYLADKNPIQEFSESTFSVRKSLEDFKFNKYILISSGEVYSQGQAKKEDIILNGTTQSTYGFHKYLAELCVQHVAKNWLIVRQSGFVGPKMVKNAVYDVINAEQLWVHPDSHFQYIHTDQSAELIFNLINKKVSNQIFNLSSLGTISVNEIMQLAGRKVPYLGDDVPIKSWIDVSKINKLLDLPHTKQTVQNFLGIFD